MSVDTNASIVDLSPALQVSSWGFAGDAGVIVARQGDGSFDGQQIQDAIGFGDSLVMNQTIPEYTAATTDNSQSNGNSGKTAPPGDSTESSAWSLKQFDHKKQVMAFFSGVMLSLIMFAN